MMTNDIENLYPQTKKQITAIFKKYFDPSTSEEFTQDVFVLALSNINNFNKKCSLKNWIYTIAKNLLKEKIRRDSYRTKQMQLFFDAESIDYRTPEKILVDKTNVNVIKDRFTKLNDFDKLIISHAVNGIKIKEAAKDLGLTESAYKVRIFRARKKLR